MFFFKKHITGLMTMMVFVSLTAFIAYAPAQQAQTQTTTTAPTPGPQGDVGSHAKRALLVVFDKFSEDEYGVTRSMLKGKGVVATVASATLDTLTGMNGSMKLLPDIVLSKVQGSDYDAIVFIGGNAYDTNNADTHRIAQEADAKGKILAAICVAPITLSKAGVLKGKRATASVEAFWLEKGGAIYTLAPVVRDGNIITASGPTSSQQFGEAIVAALEE